MNTPRLLFRRALSALTLFGLVVALQAETWVRYQARPGSKLKIDGTSTVHDWSVESKIIGGFMELESNFPLDPSAKANAGKVNAKVEVDITVRSLLSGKKVMDEVMHDAMKVQQHPKISYKLKELALKPRKEGDPLQFDALGELTVVGVTKPNKMVVSMDRINPTQLKVKGEAAVKMTDFGIKPPAPSIGLGLIKTGDDVKITFEWLTAQKADAPKAQ